MIGRGDDALHGMVPQQVLAPCGWCGCSRGDSDGQARPDDLTHLMVLRAVALSIRFLSSRVFSPQESTFTCDHPKAFSCDSPWKGFLMSS